MQPCIVVKIRVETSEGNMDPKPNMPASKKSISAYQKFKGEFDT